MIINVRSYADFKLAANTLRHLDAVFYKDFVIVQNTSPPDCVAYAFDYDDGICVAAQIGGGTAFVTADFPKAIQISGYFLVSDQSALPSAF